MPTLTDTARPRRKNRSERPPVSARRPATAWRRRTICVVTSSVLLAGAVAATAPAASAAPSTKKAPSTTAYSAGQYIVTFADEPAVSYDGNVKGYPRTRPDAGKKLDPTRSAVGTWRSHLTASTTRRSARSARRKLADYTVATNGVAVTSPAVRRAALAAVPGVVAACRRTRCAPSTRPLAGVPRADRPRRPVVAAAGRCDARRQGRHRRRHRHRHLAGEPVVRRRELKRDKAGQPVAATGLRGTWFGPCVQGEQFSSQACNDKLIGARYYVAGFGKKNIAKAEYLSPRDGDGPRLAHRLHGCGQPGRRRHHRRPCHRHRQSGWPRAPSWRRTRSAGTASRGRGRRLLQQRHRVAAIDDAVADGVDVINMIASAGPPSPTCSTRWRRPSGGRANAGIFVANSAGNSGPGASTLDHPAPWVTTRRRQHLPARRGSARAGQRAPLRRCLDHQHAVRLRPRW